MAVADFNGDGKPDLAVANYYSPTISVLINNTGGSAAVATPTFSPGGGTYTGSVTVTISDATSGATIHYTTDGSTPTTSSPVYGGALTFTQTTTLKAMAAASGMTDSAVASATYTIQQLPTLTSLTLNPSSVAGGPLGSSTGTVMLSAPAPAGGAQVTLSSSDPSVASVPASVTVPAGATSATFTVNTSIVVISTTVTISASYN